MATTQNEHNGNGTTRRFSFTFPYIKEDDVKVSLRTSTANVTTIASTNYTFPSATEIQFSAVTETDFQESTGAPKTGVTIRVFRDTDLDTERVTFFPGSSIRAQDLNDNTLQNLYASQERQNRAVDSTGGAMTGDLTMNNANIVFEGATADDFETTLTVTDPTADRTITLPDTTGTVVTTGDSNTVTSTMVDGSLVDANIAANAEIAVSKLADGNARQLLQTAADGTTVEFTDNVDIPGTLDVTGAAVFDSSVTATTFSGNATSSSVLTPGRNIGGVAFDGSADINLPGVNAQGNQDTTGNAATATALETARTIAGQSFDGTANITIAPTDLTGVNATADEINQLDGIDLIPTSPTWTSATEIPSNSQISDRIAELGGFEAIATESDFPATAPPEGVVVSIGNANALAVNASGVGAGTRSGGGAVVINGFPAEFNSTTLDDGIGLLVVSTSTAHTYDFHRVVAKNEDVRQLSSDINDFKARYRVGSTNPTTDLDSGDLFFNTGSGDMLVYNGLNTAWEEVQSIGQFFIIPAAELADFASGTASTEVISNAPTSAEQIILSINGVIQQPNEGSTAPTDGFVLDGATIRLAATPPANSDVFGIIIGSSVNVGTPSANTVDTLQLVDDGVEYAKIQNIATANRVLGSTTADGIVSEVQVQTDMIADDAVTYAKMQHTANANRVLGAAAAGAIGETQVNEAMLNVTNAPTTGQFLQCNNVSGGTGDLTWAAVPAPTTADADLFDADGTTTAFTIEAGRTVHNILVFVNGLLMRATFGGTTRDYTVSGTTLTFTTAPANGDEIDVRYLPA